MAITLRSTDLLNGMTTTSDGGSHLCHLICQQLPLQTRVLHLGHLTESSSLSFPFLFLIFSLQWAKHCWFRMHSSSSSFNPPLSFFPLPFSSPSHHCPFPYWLLMSRLHVTIEWNDGLLAITNRCFFFFFYIIIISTALLFVCFSFSSAWVLFSYLFFSSPQMRFQLTHCTGAFCLWQVVRKKERSASTEWIRLLRLLPALQRLITRQAQVLFASLWRKGKKDMETYTDRQIQTHTHTHTLQSLIMIDIV